MPTLPLALLTTRPDRAGPRQRGFTLIEVMIALAVVAILVRIALPGYQAYIVRSSRQAAQAELVALANAQEKIFLNSSAYTFSVAATATTFTLTAAPVAGTLQAGDGNLTITEAGVRTWGTKTW